MQKTIRTKKPWLFIALCSMPAFLLMAYFILWPAVQVLYLSFTNASVLTIKEGADFVGMKNFTTMFGDRRFIEAFQNTLRLLVVAPIVTIAISLLLAFMVTQSKLKERGVYRTVFFFPSIVSMTIIGIVWSFIFHPRMGVLNKILVWIGLEKFDSFPWTADPDTAIWTIAIAFIWQSAGYFMVMHIAAIDSISSEVYEAATIDGAGPVQKLFSITLPLIKNIVSITYIFALSGILDSSFALSMVMTPRERADVLLTYIYTQGYTNSQYGYSMAITAFTLVIAVGLSFFSRFVTNRKEG